jgi:signal transduction histidine kinase
LTDPVRDAVRVPALADDGETPATRAGRRLAEVEALSGIGSWEWDIRANELHWSEQLRRVYGMEPDPRPITYEDFLARVHPDDRAEVEATVSEAFRTGGSFVTEHRTVYPDGSEHLIYGRGYVLQDEDGNAVRMLGSGQDITEARAAEHRRTADERRAAAGQARDEALALLAHDLRSPLAVIVGYVQLLARQASQGRMDPDRLLPYLDRVDVAARQMTTLMDDLLADASPDGDLDQIEREPTDLAGWLRTLVEHHDGTTETHRIIAEVPAGAVVADVAPAKLERAVHNLLTNAVKYSPEGSTVRLTLEADATESRITVADEGIGIPADDVPHVFDRFHRGANATGRVGGLGLGLTSVMRAVRAHDGRVRVDSTEGHGTTFTIHLPRVT